MSLMYSGSFYYDIEYIDTYSLYDIDVVITEETQG